MWVAWATLCDDADEISPGVANIDGAGRTAFIVDDLPTRITLFVATMLTAFPSDVAKEFELTVDAMNPQGQLIGSMDQTISFDSPDPDAPDEFTISEFLLIGMVLPVDTPGTHVAELRTTAQIKPWSVHFYVQPSDEAWRRLMGLE